MINFILFHTGETRALLPSINKIIKAGSHKVRIIPVGQAAKNSLSKKLEPFIVEPDFVKQGEGKNQDYKKTFSDTDVNEVIQLCKNASAVLLGIPSVLQKQIAQALPNNVEKIVYFDGGCTREKVLDFSPISHHMIFTSEFYHQKAQLWLSKTKDTPQLWMARHGDIDKWLKHYQNQTKSNINETKDEINFQENKKLIVWVGGYGEELVSTDREGKAFKFFLSHFKLNNLTLKSDNFPYQLKITLHPGLKKYPSSKLDEIKHNYYINPLKEVGFSETECQKILIEGESEPVVRLAFAVFSAGSTLGNQAKCVGAKAKNIILDKQYNLVPAVEDISEGSRIQDLLIKWKSKKRKEVGDAAYQKSMDKSDIPEESTFDVIKRLIK